MTGYDAQANGKGCYQDWCDYKRAELLQTQFPKLFLDGRVQLYGGDCMDVLKTLPDSSIDSCITDPPYHLTSIVKRFGGDNAVPCKVGKTGAYARATTGFMGQKWDGGDIAFQREVWAEVLRVLKPGAHLLAFGGTRTYHRLACAIEDAKFEIRDAILWHYGQGFPKSHDVSKSLDRVARAERTIVGQQDRNYGASKVDENLSEPSTDAAKQWQGWGSALKPATEIICLARKPLEGTIAQNVLKHGVGGINVDGCRVAADSEYDDPRLNGKGSWSTKGMGFDKFAGTEISSSQLGRFPANIIHDGSPEVLVGFPETSSGGVLTAGDRNSEYVFGDFTNRSLTNHGANSGSAARFFYSAKANSTDRIASRHPTVKPVDLIQYLCRLITPPGGTVLDPFSGTGTTAEAAYREGFNAVLIEREADYQADIARRMELVLAGPDEKQRAIIKAKGKLEDTSGLPLFAEITK